ncbi:MAG: hypothetical protein KKE56_08255 [Actinobacteria bacterium]|nr:hypothetical protein [Actinomycetota bacterium]
MKDKIYVPGPARVMYRTYLAVLALVLYTGFNTFHPFLSGWRYPWSMSLAVVFNFYLCWILVLVAFVYLYYATLGRPKEWNEPLGLFRILIGLLTIWFFLLTFAAYRPYGWLNGLVQALGGPVGTFKVYELFLWVMLLVNVIYIYARWVKSERFPRLTSTGQAKKVV